MSELTDEAIKILKNGEIVSTVLFENYHKIINSPQRDWAKIIVSCSVKKAMELAYEIIEQKNKKP